MRRAALAVLGNNFQRIFLSKSYGGGGGAEGRGVCEFVCVCASVAIR